MITRINKIAKKLITLGLILTPMSIITSCKNYNTNDSKDNSSTSEKEVSVTLNIRKDTKFSACICDISESDFKALGFELGDSVKAIFSNGLSLIDIPYFNGYYVKSGLPLVVSYPGTNLVTITYNNQGIWDQAGLNEDITVTLSLNEKSKYLSTQEALSQSYSSDLNDYTNKYEFANFRAMKGGNLKDNLLYRGASPCDNTHGRASVVDEILKENNITYNIDLADSNENMEKYLADSTYSFPYTKALYENGNVSLLSMSSSYESTEYKQKVVKGLKEALAKSNSSSKIYIHCMEGKDRTGFVCLLIEALCGASYSELEADYMQTYYNYYKISTDTSLEKYTKIKELYFDTFLESLHKTSNIDVLKSASYVENAKTYLKDGGMSDTEIETLISFLTK